MKFNISYDIFLGQSWNTFINNAKQKYGKGKEGIDQIVWDDGITTLTIYQTHGEQNNHYGNYFSVIYADNEIMRKFNRDQSKQGPQF